MLFPSKRKEAGRLFIHCWGGHRAEVVSFCIFTIRITSLHELILNYEHVINSDWPSKVLSGM